MTEFKYSEKFYSCFGLPVADSAVRLYFANRIYVTGQENIPNEGALLLCSNHVSYFDPVIVAMTAERRLNFMGKKELFYIPELKSAPFKHIIKKSFSSILTKLGAFPVDRKKFSRSALEHAVELLKEDEALYMAPEGTTHPEINKLKEGFALIYNWYLRSTNKELQIVPAGIVYKKRIKKSNGKSFPAPFSEVRINYGKPLELKKYEDMNDKERRKAITEDLEERIRELTSANYT